MKPLSVDFKAIKNQRSGVESKHVYSNIFSEVINQRYRMHRNSEEHSISICKDAAFLNFLYLGDEPVTTYCINDMYFYITPSMLDYVEPKALPEHA